MLSASNAPNLLPLSDGFSRNFSTWTHVNPVCGSRSKSKWGLLQQCSVEARSTALKCENKKCIGLVLWNTVNFVGFLVIHVLQGSVATYVRCGGMSTPYCTANFLLSLAVKEFLKSVKI